MTPERRHDALALAIVLVVPLVLFADVLFGNNTLYVADISAYHYPLKHILREIVQRGDFPSWNPYLGGGQPLAANAAHEVFYPLTWLILLPSFNLGFHLLIVLHLMIAAGGMYALLRSLDVKPFPATLGALSFGIGGLLTSATAFFPFLFSTAWLPFVCLFGRRFLCDGNRRDFALAVGALAMQLLIGEPITVLQSAIVLIALALFMRAPLRRVVAIGVVAALLAAVQVLPLLDHFRDTDRVRGSKFEAISEKSTPPLRIAELIVPDPLDVDASKVFFLSIYPGMLVGALAIAALTLRTKGRWLFLSLLLLSFLLASGSHTPLLRALYSLGVAGVLRYPEKFVILGVFATIVFAARAFDDVLAERKRLMIVLALIALASFALSWMHAARAIALLLIVAALPRMRTAIAFGALAIFVAIDLLTVTLPMSPRQPASFYDEPPALQKLAREKDTYRIFSLAEWSTHSPNGRAYSNINHPDRAWIRRNELLPNRPLTWDFRLALDNDYDLTGLARTTDFAIAASKLAEEHHPDWVNAFAAMANVRYVGIYRNPQRAFADARGDAKKLQPVTFIGGKGSPRYYFSSRMVPIANVDDFLTRLRRERFPRDVAFVEGPTFATSPGRVVSVRETSNSARIEVESSGTAFLVMSVTAHKYWRITIDGQRVPVLPTNIAYQGVVVPRGMHIVEMHYANPLLWIGAAISIVTFAALLWASTMRAL